MTITETIKHKGIQAKKAAQELLGASADDKTDALHRVAIAVESAQETILAANATDLENGRNKHLDNSLLDRLELTPQRIAAIANGIRKVAAQDDPIGSINHIRYVHNGLKIGKMRTPLGVIGIVYESRPNVTIDAAAICLKSGNACILRGGSEAFNTNMALMQCIREGLQASAISSNAIQFVDTTDREAVTAMLEAKGLIDVMIPRGGKGLVSLISEKAKIPVIKHLDGICHVYIDQHANNDMACDVAVNAKTYRYGICGAMETLLIHKDKVEELIPRLISLFGEKHVDVVADAALASRYNLASADENDWSTEYLGPKLSIKAVNSIDDAITHINHYGSHHTDSIVTDSITQQNQFLALVDSASVMVNTPTCFADGFEYGLGAEIGISTDKLHARGPVGVLELTTEKFIILGNGETRSS